MKQLKPFLLGSSFCHSLCIAKETSRRSHRGPEMFHKAESYFAFLSRRFAARRPASLTLMSLKLNVTLQYLQFRVLSSHSRSLCLSLSFRRMEAWQASHCTRSNSQRPSCWVWEKENKTTSCWTVLTQTKYVCYSFTLKIDNETDRWLQWCSLFMLWRLLNRIVLWVIEKWMAVGVVQGLFASALKTGFWFHFIQSNQ